MRNTTFLWALSGFIVACAADSSDDVLVGAVRRAFESESTIVAAGNAAGTITSASAKAERRVGRAMRPPLARESGGMNGQGEGDIRRHRVYGTKAPKPP